MDVEDITELDEIYEIITKVEFYNRNLEKLEKKYSVPKFSNIEWRPLSLIEINKEDDAKTLFKLLEKLEEIDDVQNIASNFNINESLMEKII